MLTRVILLKLIVLQSGMTVASGNQSRPHQDLLGNGDAAGTVSNT